MRKEKHFSSDFVITYDLYPRLKNPQIHINKKKAAQLLKLIESTFKQRPLEGHQYNSQLWAIVGYKGFSVGRIKDINQVPPQYEYLLQIGDGVVRRLIGESVTVFADNAKIEDFLMKTSQQSPMTRT